MIYTSLGRIAAALLFIFGILGLVIGLGVVTNPTIEPESVRVQLMRMSGQLIEYGAYSIIWAIALGILTDISQSIARLRQ